MPKYEHTQAPGTLLPARLRKFLLDIFDDRELEKLETLGGRVSVAISTVQKGIKKNKSKIVDQEYIDYLVAMGDGGNDAQSELLSLTRTQLNQVCERLELPISSQLTNRDVIRIIENRISAGRRWRHIIKE